MASLRARTRSSYLTAVQVAFLLFLAAQCSPGPRGCVIDRLYAAVAPPSPELMAEMGAFVGEAIQSDVLVTTGPLEPKGTRLRLAGGKFNAPDGPFIELKELLGGFAVLQVKSLEETIEWSMRFRSIVGDDRPGPWEKTIDHRWPVRRGQGTTGRFYPARGQRPE